MSVAGYLGPKGTYTEKAAGILCPNSEKREYSSFYEVFGALKAGIIDSAVVPIENAIQGSVTQCLDLLYDSGAFIVKETTVQIEHRLIVMKGAGLADIKRVYSHEQAIKQCSEFLGAELPGASVIYTDSTAMGAKMIKSREDAAIGGEQLAEGNLEALDAEIANEPENCTKFVEIRSCAPSGGGKVFFATGGENKPGALLNILQIIKEHNLNMTKIESRPVKRHFGSYLFFIEIEGGLSDGKVQDCLNQLKNFVGFKLLGAY